MATLAALVVIAMIAFVGLVLHRALATFLLSYDSATSAAGCTERDLLLLGLLPGFAIVGTVGIYLALFHALHPAVFTAVLIAALAWRRKDAREVLEQIAALAIDIWRSLRSLDPFSVGGAALFMVLFAAFVLNAQIPSDATDISLFQLPLARSMVEHSGFVVPQISNLFYSFHMHFFNLLFAEIMMFVDRSASASLLNVTIFLGFIAALTTFYRRNRAVGFALGLFIIAYSSFFSAVATVPLVEIPRTCFSVMGLLFAYRYLQNERLYDIVAAGLVFGAAIGGHYLELIPLAMLSLHLLPRLMRGRKVWIHAVAFVGTLCVVASYWYLRNWIVMGNPIWPLLFGHQGIDDTQYAEIVLVDTVPLRESDRIYTNDLRTAAGWRDMILVLYRWFLTLMPGAISVALVFLSIAFGRARIGILVWWTAILFVLWFALMFHLRWALPAFLLLCSTAVIGTASLVERIESAREAAFGKADAKTLRLGRISAGAIGIAACLAIGLRIAVHGFAVLPTWIDTNLVRSVLSGNTIASYLATQVPGYSAFRYVAEHDLKMVFAPFSDQSKYRAASFNDGRDEGWFLAFDRLPDSVDDFLMQHGMVYFLDEPAPYSLNPSQMNSDFAAGAIEIASQLRQRGRLLMTDAFGWSLYEVPSSRPR